MAAYLLVEIEITDPEGYEKYKRLAAPTVGAYDGRYVVRGGTAEILEGDWKLGRVVVLEFPTVQRAKEWWSSEDYAAARQLRQRCATTRMVVVAGISSS